MKSCIGISHIGLLIVLAGCNSSGNNDAPGAHRPPPDPPPAASFYVPCNPAPPTASAGRAAIPGGIWEGTLTNELLKSSGTFWAQISEDGRFRMRGHRARMNGTIVTGDNSFSGDGYAHIWGDWSAVPLDSDFNVAGTIIERQGMNATWTMSSGDLGCFAATYETNIYEQASSLPLVEGVWISYDAWSWPWYLTIEADGRVLWQDPYFCSMSGQISVIDDRYNLYDISLASTCDAGAVPYTGFAYLSLSQNSIMLSIDNGSVGYFNSWGR